MEYIVALLLRIMCIILCMLICLLVLLVNQVNCQSEAIVINCKLARVEEVLLKETESEELVVGASERSIGINLNH